MQKREEVYQKLREIYTDEELAESFIFSVELPEEEEKLAREEFLKLRMERLNSMTTEEKLASALFTLKLKMKNYFKTDQYEEQFKFSNQLKKYIQITKRTHLEIAKNLDIHKTKLSRLVNGRDNPNIDIMYRLEAHSNQEIPAVFWWKLHARELEHKIQTDNEKRKKEADRVANVLNLNI